ncbi:MAG: universal stress protein [Gemmatimonadetes bacterium]|nr:universal stress protein [Gemmatimonadota bacterium]
MLDIRRVLVPTDFSDCARAAVRPAIALARRHEAELHMVHVRRPGSGDPEPPTEFPGEAEARAALASGESDRAVVRHVIEGRAPGLAILELAGELDVDVIVIGSHGRRGLRRLTLGSVAEEVVRFARRPVLVVHADEDRERPADAKRLLVAVDFSDATPTLLAHASHLAASLDAGLDLLHVVPIPMYPTFYVAELALPQNRRASRERLEQMAADLEPRVDTTIEVGDGRPPDEIVEYAEEHGHDLIVVSSHGYTGVKRLLLGSTAEGVIRRAPCPVLVVKPGGRQLAPEAEVHATSGADANVVVRAGE